MKNGIDVLLNQALTPDYDPDDLLNQRILNQVKEKKNMKHKKISAALVAAALIAAMSATAIAATHFLSAEDVAEEFGQEELAQEFKKKDSATAQQVMEQGDYRFALLGTLSGSEITDILSDAELDETYIVVAAERLDGSAVSEEETFVASSLIQGLDPFDYNIYTMGGGATYDVVGGIYYMIVSCRNVEIFADRQIYVAVTTGPDYRTGFRFDADSGLISREEDFEGINVLFEVELDASKADQAAQEEYLAGFAEGDAEEPSYPYSGDAGSAPMLEDGVDVFESEYANFAMSVDYGRLSEEDLQNIMSIGTSIEKGISTEKDGNFCIDYDNEYMSGTGMIMADGMEENQTFFSPAGGSEEGITFEYQRREGGELTYEVLHYDEKQIKAIYDYFH